MLPVLYKCSLFTVYTYGLFVAIAFVVATTLMSQEARRRQLQEESIYNLSLVLLAGGIVFARLLYVLLNWEFFKDNLLEIVYLQHGGLVWFGGLGGAFFSGFVYLKMKKMPFWETIDFLSPYAALVQYIGRIGCFFNGCCYGKEVNSFGVYFPVHGRSLFPSQILDSLTLLFIYIILKSLPLKRRRGEVFVLYLILASLQRFLMEFIRGDERAFYLGLSVFQWMSLSLMTSGAALYLILIWKKKSS